MCQNPSNYVKSKIQPILEKRQKKMGFQGQFLTLFASWAGLKILMVLPNFFVGILIYPDFLEICQFLRTVAVFVYR